MTGFHCLLDPNKGIVDGDNPVIRRQCNNTPIHSDWSFDTKLGDTFRLDFDFKAKKCTAFYNDKLVGLLANDLPQNIYFAAASYYEGTFETTLFEEL